MIRVPGILKYFCAANLKIKGLFKGFLKKKVRSGRIYVELYEQKWDLGAKSQVNT